MAALGFLFFESGNQVALGNITVEHHGQIPAKESEGQGMASEVMGGFLTFFIAAFGHSEFLEKVSAGFIREIVERRVLDWAGHRCKFGYDKAGGDNTQSPVRSGTREFLEHSLNALIAQSARHFARRILNGFQTVEDEQRLLPGYETGQTNAPVPG